MLRALVLVLLLAPLGCAVSTEPSSSALSGGMLSVERAEHRPGETATVVLRNTSDQTIGYNLCMSAREIREGSEWRRIETLRTCLAALFSLEPGQEVVHEEPITEEWRTGTYRMVTDVELMEDGERLRVHSGPFTVAR